MSGETDSKKPLRIWAVQCPFKADGLPSLGGFGSTVRPVVIIPLETWEQLCKDVPQLQRTNFEVGS